MRRASGAEYDFIWSGPKRRRDNGVGFLVKVDRNTIAGEPDTQDPRIIAVKITVYEFKTRIYPTKLKCLYAPPKGAQLYAIGFL